MFLRLGEMRLRRLPAQSAGQDAQMHHAHHQPQIEHRSAKPGIEAAADAARQHTVAAHPRTSDGWVLAWIATHEASPPTSPIARVALTTAVRRSPRPATPGRAARGTARARTGPGSARPPSAGRGGPAAERREPGVVADRHAHPAGLAHVHHHELCAGRRRLPWASRADPAVRGHAPPLGRVHRRGVADRPVVAALVHAAGCRPDTEVTGRLGEPTVTWAVQGLGEVLRTAPAGAAGRRGQRRRPPDRPRRLPGTRFVALEDGYGIDVLSGAAMPRTSRNACCATRARSPGSPTAVIRPDSRRRPRHLPRTVRSTGSPAAVLRRVGYRAGSPTRAYCVGKRPSDR